MCNKYPFFKVGLIIILLIASSTFMLAADPIIEIRDKLSSVEKEMMLFGVSKDFFSSILNAQTTIFSMIVILLAGFSWFISSNRTKKMIDEEIVNIKKDNEEWRKETRRLVGEAIKQISDDLTTQLQHKAATLNADICRAYAQLHLATPPTSLIWWLRAARDYNLIGASSLLRIALDSAYDQSCKIKYSYDLFDLREEISQIMTMFDRELYKTQLALIDEELMRIQKDIPTRDTPK